MEAEQMTRLEGKVAIVTGAGSGIGRATALMMAREGAHVVCVDITGDEVATSADIGGRSIALRCDVSDGESVAKMIGAARAKFGRVDILFNNAGIAGLQGPTADCTEENWDRVIGINLKGVWLGMKHAIPVMLETGGGAIINTASVAGLVGFPGLPAYCASKGGIVQLTKTAALEYAKQGIRVNAVCPGVIWTPMVEEVSGGTEEGKAQFSAIEPVGRMGTPDEVAALVVFLASDEASFMTGAAIPVDGAYVAQ